MPVAIVGQLSSTLCQLIQRKVFSADIYFVKLYRNKWKYIFSLSRSIFIFSLSLSIYVSLSLCISLCSLSVQVCASRHRQLTCDMRHSRVMTLVGLPDLPLSRFSLIRICAIKVSKPLPILPRFSHFRVTV